jgi:hypothetical protein
VDLHVPDDLNEKKSIMRLKEQLISAIPYVPTSAEAKRFLLSHDIGDLLHIYHFWRQRFPQPVARRYHAPSGVRNDPLYVRHKARIGQLKRKIEVGEDVSAYLSRRAHNKALDINGYRESKSFNSSRDLLLVCEGFYHLHLAPLPERTDEILVALVTPDLFEVIGLFTHDLFTEDSLNPAYVKYNQAVEAYLARRFPSGGIFLGGPGGGMQNAAGSSIASTFWQIHHRKILSHVEAYPDGLNGFTIKLYGEIFDRQTRFVDPKWEVADDGRLLIRDRKNKHEFWADGSNWQGQPWS